MRASDLPEVLLDMALSGQTGDRLGVGGFDELFVRVLPTAGGAVASATAAELRRAMGGTDPAVAFTTAVTLDLTGSGITRVDLSGDRGCPFLSVHVTTPQAGLKARLLAHARDTTGG